MTHRKKLLSITPFALCAAALFAVFCTELDFSGHWDDPANKKDAEPTMHTVTFHANGGTGSAPTAQTVSSGATIILPGQSGLSRSGHTFGGWNTNSAGTGSSFSAGASYTVTGAATLYAVWIDVSVPTFTVTFNANGGTGSAPAAQTVSSGSNITLPGQGSLTKSGHTFGGWNTNSGGTGVNYGSGASYTVTNAVTFYAVWIDTSVPTNTITFDANGGSGTPPSQLTVNSGAEITLPDGSGLEKTGFTFAGWSTNSGGTGTNYDAGAEYNVTGDVTLYAKWNVVTPTGCQQWSDWDTTETASCAAAGSQKKVCTQGTAADSVKSIPKLTGAQCEITQYTVTFSTNGATSGTAPTSQTAISGSAITLPGVGNMARSEHTFGGWNTAAAGNGTNYNAGATYTVTGNATLYAKWNETSSCNSATTYCADDADIGKWCVVGNNCTQIAAGQSRCGGTVSFTNTCQTTTPPLVGKFRDTRDDRDYDSVRIGTQVWMAENLNYAGTSGNVGVCYNNLPSNCDTYGRLYRWVEAMAIDQSFETSLWSGSDVNHQGICPSGWRVPSSADWDALTTAVGSTYVDEGSYGYWPNAGTKLKSQSGWYVDYGTDEFGFSALPGGGGWYGDFFYAGYGGGWWSAAEYDAAGARYRNMHYDTDNVISYWDNKGSAFSVRCLRD